MPNPPLTYASVCSGIEAPSVAWAPLGWKRLWFSEIDKFPRAVLAHHYPDTPNLGDMEKIDARRTDRPDVLIGGTPCQSFSVAGLRGGLDDPRGNLALIYLRLVDRLRPTWFVWENVPGVLSSNRGRDFGAFLGTVGKLGYGFAYRVLDAQFFGVPQRRRRVFIVGHSSGLWQLAAAVLFDAESLRGNPTPGREAREVAPTIPARRSGGGGLGTDFDCDGGLICMAHGQGGAEIRSDGEPSLTCNHEAPIVFDSKRAGQGGIVAPPLRAMNSTDGRENAGGQLAVAHTLRGEGFDASEDGTGRGTPLVPVAYDMRGRDGGAALEGPSPTAALRASSGGSSRSYVQTRHVRRLTPLECERLQGFPDNYTNIPYGRPKHSDQICPDGPRYKALGNSMAVPVIRWIGERLTAVHDIITQEATA